ncbi:MAG: alanine racemase [Flaviflexus sp.]|nr:alanine racemase [Flaviflexus sp.]
MSAARFPSTARIDLEALAHNHAVLAERAQGRPMIGVVKADAYGHGLAEVGATLLDCGVAYLGVAQLAEAFTLREALPQAPILSWIYPPGADLVAAIEAGIEISVPAPWAIEEIASAAETAGTPARIHLEIDTGMSRGGLTAAQLGGAAERLAELEGRATEVVGLWSHLVRADEPDHPLTAQQTRQLIEAGETVANLGLHPIRHLANSAGLLWHEATHLDMVRPGIALYGLSPNPAVASAEQLGLRPVMSLEAPVVSVREVPAGTGVSYNHTEQVGPCRLATVPLGYADGIPRAASRRAEVVAGRRRKIIGTVCMDQFVIEGEDLEAGDCVRLFGADAPSADEWAAHCGTIGYEITTRIGPRVPRRYSKGSHENR